MPRAKFILTVYICWTPYTEAYNTYTEAYNTYNKASGITTLGE